MTVEFKKPFRGMYFPGQRAGFDEETEAALVEAGVAGAVETQKPAKTGRARKAPANKMGSVPETKAERGTWDAGIGAPNDPLAKAEH